MLWTEGFNTDRFVSAIVTLIIIAIIVRIDLRYLTKQRVNIQLPDKYKKTSEKKDKSETFKHNEE